MIFAVIESMTESSIKTIAVCCLIGFVVFLVFAYNIIDTIVTNKRLANKRKCNNCPSNSTESVFKEDFFTPFTEARKSNFTVTSTASGPSGRIGPEIKVSINGKDLSPEESAAISNEINSTFNDFNKDFSEFMNSIFDNKADFNRSYWNTYGIKLNTRLNSINNKIREAADKQKAADNPPKTNTEPPKEKNDAV